MSIENSSDISTAYIQFVLISFLKLPSPYKYSDLVDYDPKTPRKMLLHKKEIKRLIGLISTKGNTLIATKVFEKNGFIKVEVALARGKKDYDKRKKIEEKRVSKEIRDYK